MPDEPINFTASASRLTAKHAMTDLALHDPSVIEAYTQVMHSASNLLDIAQVAATSQSGRYISGITSKCPVCQYEETIDIPLETDVAGMIQAIQAVKDLCPMCEEVKQEMIARRELSDILNVDGLEPLEEG